ncbi:MAG: uroporphyrinogen decarboxylase family protein [Chloroflexota bacterium]
MALSKRERVDAALRGGPVDRVPVSAWRHFIPEETGVEALAQAHLQFFNRFDWDWLKANPRATYYAEAWGNRYDYAAYDRVYPRLLDGPLNSPAGLESIQPVNPTGGPFAGQLELARRLKAGLGGAHFIFTVFSPLSVLGFLASRPAQHRADVVVQEHANAALRCIRENPAGAHAALSAIAGTLAGFAAALVESGASGLFFAIVKLARQGVLTPAEYAEFGRPYDLQVLQAVQGAPFNLLHICGQAVHFDAVADFPVHALNWAAVNQGNPTVGDAFDRTRLAVVGGVDEDGVLLDGAPEQVAAEASAALQAARGSRLLLAPGCAVAMSTPDANLDALRAAVEHI